MLLENDDGNSQVISLTDLRILLETISVTVKTKCVFLAACNSEKHGRILHEAGASHVICTNRQISNESQLEFTRKFYECIFGEGLSVCFAFKMAVDFLKIHSNFACQKDWPNYQLLTSCK